MMWFAVLVIASGPFAGYHVLQKDVVIGERLECEQKVQEILKDQANAFTDGYCVGRPMPYHELYWKLPPFYGWKY
jgi:hypothetical protein